MDFDQTLSALGTVPIPGDVPAGQSARFEAEFETMQAEVDRLRALDGAPPDWALVAASAQTLLATKSKDVLIACYLCAALRETHGWAGLADGFNVIKGMFATFWEGMEPTRLRARKAAVDWLLDRCNALIESAPVQDADRPAMLACVAVIDELVAFGESRWEGDAPTLWSLGKAITGRTPAEIVAAPVAEAVADTAAPTPSGQPSAGAVSGGSSAGMAMGALASRADAYRAISAAADLLRAVEPHSPVSYLLQRAVSWGAMPLPALYAELQRAGTVWDLVLQPLPEGGAPVADAPRTYTAPPPAPSAAPVAEPEPAPAAPSRPRGDF